MVIVLCIATVVLLAITFLPIWRNPHWLIRSLEFARLQIAALAILLLLLQFMTLRLNALLTVVLISLTMLCMIWQLWWILPYTRLKSREVLDAENIDPNRSLRILTANVQISYRNAQGLLDLIRQHQPDVIVTVESDQWWQDQLDTLDAQWPHSIKCPLENGYGMHLYSRLPLHESDIRYLVESDIPSIHTLVTLPSNDAVRLRLIHPTPPFPTENPRATERNIELVEVARTVAAIDEPVIVAGDFNDVAWSSTTRLFRKISGLLDPRVGKGMFNTFHARYPIFRWPLDYIFHSDHFTLVSIRRLASFGSDHFPLLTELAYTPHRKEEQEGLEADAEDHARAAKIAQE